MLCAAGLIWMRDQGPKTAVYWTPKSSQENLYNLMELKMFLLIAQNWTRWPLKVSSNTKYSMILIYDYFQVFWERGMTKKLSLFLLVYFGGPILFLLTDWFMLHIVSPFMRTVLLLCFPSLEQTKVRLCGTGKGIQSKHGESIFPLSSLSPHQIAHVGTKCQHKWWWAVQMTAGRTEPCSNPPILSAQWKSQ